MRLWVIAIILSAGMLRCGGGNEGEDGDTDSVVDDSGAEEAAEPDMDGDDMDGDAVDGDVGSGEAADGGTDDEMDAAGDADAVIPVPGCDDPRFASYVAALQQDLTRNRVPGVAVAVVEGDDVTFACGLGTTRTGPEGVPVQPTTLFRIGSMTKTLTAVAVLQLVEEGLVDLAAPVTDYVPGFHYDRDTTWASSFTIEQLLTHTAGQFGDFLMDAPPEEQTDEALRAFFTTGRYPGMGYLMVTPGTLWNYSNTGFMVLGLVAEAVRGEFYRQLILERILQPLGMDRTMFLPEEVLADGDFAYGQTTPSFWVDGDGIVSPVVAPDAYENAWARPCGYAWSSALDLTRFLLFLAHGDTGVLGEEMRTAMLAPHVPTHSLVTAGGEDLESSGYGLIVDRGINLQDGWRQLSSVVTAGGMPGYVAKARYFPEQRFGYVFLSNADGGNFQPSFKILFDLLTTLPPVWDPGLAVDPARLPLYAGTYLDPFILGEVRVTYTSGGGLTVQLPQMDALGVSYGRASPPARRTTSR